MQYACTCNVNNVLHVNVMIYILLNRKCSLVFFLAGIKVITEKWSVKCKMNSWNEWNVICISMVNFFLLIFTIYFCLSIFQYYLWKYRQHDILFGYLFGSQVIYALYNFNTLAPILILLRRIVMMTNTRYDTCYIYCLPWDQIVSCKCSWSCMSTI